MGFPQDVNEGLADRLKRRRGQSLAERLQARQATPRPPATTVAHIDDPHQPTEPDSTEKPSLAARARAFFGPRPKPAADFTLTGRGTRVPVTPTFPDRPNGE